MIKKDLQKKADSAWETINPERVYSDEELSRFDKIRGRFMMEKILKGEKVSVFDFDRFSVAFGACIKVTMGGVDTYPIPHKTFLQGVLVDGPERYRKMSKLLSQYEAWRHRQEYREKTLSEIPF